MQQPSCQEKWVDCFVTKPDRDFQGEYVTDDQFVCAVQTVDLATLPELNLKLASIVNYKTPYILATFSAAYDQPHYKDHILHSIGVGDNVRIGNSRTDNTDLLTVLEVIELDGLFNMIDENVIVTLSPVSLSGKATLVNEEMVLQPYSTLDTSIYQIEFLTKGMLVAPSSSLQLTVATPDLDGVEDQVRFIYDGVSAPESNLYFPFTKQGIAHKVLRLNVEVNVTKFPANMTRNVDNPYGAFSSVENAWLRRHEAFLMPKSQSVSQNTAEVKYYFADGTYATSEFEKLYDDALPYSLYLEKDWTSQLTLTLPLDHRIKLISEIQLIGYSAVNKRRNIVQSQDSLPNDDFFIMQIDEISGNVLSNNKFADGAFAVLRMVNTTPTDNIVHMYDPLGIVKYNFSKPLSSVRKLSVRLFDRRGKPAHIGRLHLWFRLLVSHG